LRLLIDMGVYYSGDKESSSNPLLQQPQGTIIVVRHLFILTAICLLFSCSKPDGLTESQLRFTEALHSQTLLIDKANDILDKKLTGIFLSDLNHITYASEIAFHAKQVFVDAKISIENDHLTALNERISAFEDDAGITAIRLLHQSVDMTIAFKEDIEDMPLQPLTSNSNATSDGMIKFLGKQYNTELTNCCLSHLRNLSIFLGQVDDLKHYALRRTIANVELRLADILTNPEKAKAYRQHIDKLMKNYDVE